MQEPMKQHQAKEMHKYVLGLLGIWLLFLITAPIASLRVSQDKKFANVGFHVKSWTLEGKFEKLADKLSATKAKLHNFSQPGLKEPNVSPIEMVNLSQNAQPFNSINQVTEITDAKQLATLNQQLYHQIAKKLPVGQRFKEKLVYRVTVNEAGAIANYEPLNQAASDEIQQTPLGNLQKQPLVSHKPVGQFEVVFTSRGVLEVSPWRGWQ